MTKSTQDLLSGWLDMWNGDTSVVRDLLTPDFRAHALFISGEPVDANGPEGMAAWVEEVRSDFTSLHYVPELGPIREDDKFAYRWLGEGIYKGGIPQAAAPAGSPIKLRGTDILRVADDRIAEYWLNADQHLILHQLQISF